MLCLLIPNTITDTKIHILQLTQVWKYTYMNVMFMNNACLSDPAENGLRINMVTDGENGLKIAVMPR